jgi:caffeoyl-CoA O-methyltransferase
MEFIDNNLLNYAERHTAAESALLSRINRETHLKVLKPRMLSGHLQGRLLSMISRMLAPKSILEIGTYTGYSAICLAEGLSSGGKIITIDRNEELEDQVKGYFRDAGLDKVIDYRLGDARTIIPSIDGPFDLVFIDADKENNTVYYDLVIDKVPAGGYILADNVLWSGKVLDENPDKHTRSIVEFNERIQNDDRVENLLIPVRDGLMIMRKTGR